MVVCWNCVCPKAMRSAVIIISGWHDFGQDFTSNFITFYYLEHVANVVIEFENNAGVSKWDSFGLLLDYWSTTNIDDPFCNFTSFTSPPFLLLLVCPTIYTRAQLMLLHHHHNHYRKNRLSTLQISKCLQLLCVPFHNVLVQSFEVVLLHSYLRIKTIDHDQVIRYRSQRRCHCRRYHCSQLNCWWRKMIHCKTSTVHHFACY